MSASYDGPRCAYKGEQGRAMTWFWVKRSSSVNEPQSKESIELICGKCAKLERKDLKSGMNRVGWLTELTAWEVGEGRTGKCSYTIEGGAKREGRYNCIPKDAIISGLYHKICCHSCENEEKKSLGECVCLTCAAGFRSRGILCRKCGSSHQKDKNTHRVIWRTGMTFAWAFDMVERHAKRADGLMQYATDSGKVNDVAETILQFLNSERIRKCAQLFKTSDDSEEDLIQVDMVMWLIQIARTLDFLKFVIDNPPDLSNVPETHLEQTPGSGSLVDSCCALPEPSPSVSPSPQGSSAGMSPPRLPGSQSSPTLGVNRSPSSSPSLMGPVSRQSSMPADSPHHNLVVESHIVDGDDTDYDNEWNIDPVVAP